MTKNPGDRLRTGQYQALFDGKNAPKPNKINGYAEFQIMKKQVINRRKTDKLQVKKEVLQ